ncbi:PH domain-containing protein [Kribbella qitaiheensis]|uniref:PH domain-containing protein n=1 Tax=Kribbella qitaiheensis TaxID=1544730 RepID=A0A7G6WV98_9ACTN|nr:PH domain-containing protein [Kribbella qitaiheensis]QNE17913.1 PH domain-containing protein [Kribbella qitaiheensis]
MTQKPSLWTFHPWIIAMMAAVMGVCIIAVFGVIWFRFDDESRATFSWFQRLTLLAFFGVVLWLLYRMGTVRVTAYEDGLAVRNVFKSYRYAWSDVKALRFNPGDPWLQLFDANGNRLGVLAIQASEGSRAGAAAKHLAGVARAHGAGPSS